MGMCNKCSKLMGILFIIAAILFLLVDMGKWAFWGIQWWTILLFLIGLCHFGKSKCKMCK